MNDNLFSLLIRLYQKPSILFLIIIKMGYLPNSPYSITCGVLFLTFNIYFRKSVWMFSLVQLSNQKDSIDSEAVNQGFGVFYKD